jgi:hypothetical protein
MIPPSDALWRGNGRSPSPATWDLTGEARERVRASFAGSHLPPALCFAALLLSVAASDDMRLSFVSVLVELRGLEPLTSTLPVSRSPN